MTLTKNQKTAIDYLNAVRVAAPTARVRWRHVDGYAYYADETTSYYLIDESDLERLGDMLADPDQEDAYSFWCAETPSGEMPRGWTPETADEFVTVEEMPDHIRASHRAAGNWGQYPLNGAQRRLVHRDEAEEIVAADDDQYDHVVAS